TGASEVALREPESGARFSWLTGPSACDALSVMIPKRFLSASLCFGLALSGEVFLARADVKLHSLFSDHMVLQQGVRAPVWGRADEGEQVTVTFRGRKVSATALNGKWMVKLPGLKAGAPDTLIVEGKNRIELKNV